MPERRTADELKLERDGQLSYGRHRGVWERGMFPKVTGVGRDEDGEVVAVLKSMGPGTGEIQYGDREWVAEWERTEAGEALDALNRGGGT